MKKFFCGDSALKEAKVSMFANKVKSTVFWDERSIIRISYLKKYFASSLDQFEDDLERKDVYPSIISSKFIPT